MNGRVKRRLRFWVISGLGLLALAACIAPIALTVKMGHDRAEMENHLYSVLARVVNGEDAYLDVGKGEFSVSPREYAAYMDAVCSYIRRAALIAPNERQYDASTAITMRVGGDVMSIYRGTGRLDFFKFTFRGSTHWFSYDNKSIPVAKKVGELFSYYME